MTVQTSSMAPAQADEAIQTRRTDLHVALGQAILKDPAILEAIPDGVVVALLPPDADEAFVETEIALGIDALRKGRSVYFKWLAPGEWGIDSSGQAIATAVTAGTDRE